MFNGTRGTANLLGSTAVPQGCSVAARGLSHDMLQVAAINLTMRIELIEDLDGALR